MTVEEKKAYLNRVYGLAVSRGIVKNVKELAEALDVNAAGLSSAKNGHPSHLSDRMMKRIQKFAALHHLEDGSPAPAQPTQPKAQPEQDGVFLPEATRRMFENMSETIRLQAEMLAHFQGVIPIVAVGDRQKKPAEAEDI